MTPRRVALRALLAAACLACPIVGLSAPATVPATNPKPMSLKQAVDFALAHNSDVLKAEADAESAGATLAAGRAATLPTVAGELQSQLNKQQNNSGSFAQIGAVPSSTFSLNTAAVTGAFNGVNLTNIYTARNDKALYDEAEQRLRVTSQQTIFSVEQAFYALVSDAELVRIAGENVAYSRALLAISEANFKAGKVAGLDKLKAQVAYTTALEQLATNSADEEDARENLAQLIGTGMGQQFDVPQTVPEPALPSLDIRALDELALSNRPEVAIAQAALDSAYISYKLVDAPNRPNVALTGAWGNQVSPTSNAQNFDFCRAHGFTAAECQSVIPVSHFYDISILSTWALPLLDWGTVHAGHDSARQLIYAQSVALGKSQQQALIDVDQAARRILVSRDNVRLASANSDVARQAALISAVQYKVGLITQTDVQASQQQYLTAERDLLAAQVTYVLALAKLKLATGTLTGAV